jgi:hypothetical protein
MDRVHRALVPSNNRVRGCHRRLLPFANVATSFAIASIAAASSGPSISTVIFDPLARQASSRP